MFLTGDEVGVVREETVPEVVTVLQSFSFGGGGGGGEKPGVFCTRFAGGGVALFQVGVGSVAGADTGVGTSGTEKEVKLWCDTMNYWAARYSVGAIGRGSGEFGWGEVSELGDGVGRGSEEGRRGSDESSSASNDGLGKDQPKRSSGFFNRKVIEDWEPPRSSTSIVSLLDEGEQLGSVGNQLQLLGQDLESHIGYRNVIERKYLVNPVARARALNNWNRKKEWLEEEIERYSLYYRALSFGHVASVNTTNGVGLGLINDH
ncbi:hypothetical protein BCR33DRAFT_724929 [Rhizoclosmatium globosum]|uniref:Uncharacterized protein n=1 Tax=Rhizoclosmatium globosum TaxID=329046 RepID=A0A1Y2B2L4_9FUNG|nr:hypothetical protein BCR33DRAFT_724929 [Rhizoclosmatium globosum]|eukprot:ORY28737.1 hypothetical protein BCR33DRAFT_724929 [Rhizoclosmatium globosum]